MVLLCCRGQFGELFLQLQKTSHGLIPQRHQRRTGRCVPKVQQLNTDRNRPVGVLPDQMRQHRNPCCIGHFNCVQADAGAEHVVFGLGQRSRTRAALSKERLH